MTSEEIAAAGPGGPLMGTLSRSGASDAPILLLSPGSGPTDRDGNNPFGLKAQPYRLLAEALAARGVDMVRIDKRGMFASRAAGDPNAVTIGEYVADAASWIASIRGRTGANEIWLAGHSEGGLVALAAARLDGVKGLVLIAAPGWPLGVVLREQLRANPANAPLLDQAFAVIAALENGDSVDEAALHPALFPLFRKEVQAFLASLLAVDPTRLMAQVRQPALIVQGGRDLQVTEADALRLREANAAARLLLLPEMNHVLKAAPVDRAGNLATYADPALALAPGLADGVAAFVKGG